MNKTPKWPRYQDYVIKDGRLVGDFEGMYRDYEDPWEQATREENRSEKAVALSLLKKYHCRRVLELGCGKGGFTAKISDLGIAVTGVDIAPTAIQKARACFPHISFEVGDILDFDLYRRIAPDCIIMSEITWYILDKLDAFLEFYCSLRNVRLLHLLALYPSGVQQYGADKFTTLDGILRYFNLDFDECGQVTCKDLDWAFRSWFMASGPASIRMCYSSEQLETRYSCVK